VVARAYCLDEVLARPEQFPLEGTTLNAEVARFDKACIEAVHELDAIIARVGQQLGEDKAAIFRGHRQLARDPALLGKVKSRIMQGRVDARVALQEVLAEYANLFAQIQDEYLRDRMADVRDVVARISAHLSLDARPPQLDLKEPVILVATEILPSQALAFDRLHVAGILTETGGTTGHVAILARSLSIPAVSGLRGILKEVQTGDLIALDGREGFVHLNPGPEVEAAYRKLEREYAHLLDRLIENRDLESVTADGIQVELLANVNSAADAALAGRVGAVGVGLYRTEYLFLTHPSVPNEEEQLQAYRAVIEASPNRRVTVRTLDLGGDKQVPYLGDQQEANPFMGWRSIRMSTAHPEFFQTQLRAILRAGLHGDISLLFPMVSTLEEVQRLKRMVARTQASLRHDGIPFAEQIPIGVMLEVPAAALCVDLLLDEVDFVSIGSNDLIQYVMAADRDNPKVAHLCEPYSPAILRLLSHVIKTCEERGKPATVCGEMAGRPRCFLPLFGMGLRRFSMSPALLPTLKELARRSTLIMARRTTERALQMRTLGEVRGYLGKRVRHVWPHVMLLDTSK
jgi:phosphoenolpyruvate-protein phosphotransferase